MGAFVEMVTADGDVALDEPEDAAGTVVCERRRLDRLATKVVAIGCVVALGVALALGLLASKALLASLADEIVLDHIKALTFGIAPAFVYL